jgi:hypothetical protein
MKEKRIEFPEIDCYMLDKQMSCIYIELEDKIMQERFTIMFDAYHFLEWIDQRNLDEIKKHLIEKIKRK